MLIVGIHQPVSDNDGLALWLVHWSQWLKLTDVRPG